MRTDWIDVMLCHEGGIDDPTIYIEGFEQLKKEGHVRVYGISTNSLDVLRRFHELSGGKCDVVEVDWSLLHRDAETGVLPFCLEHNIAVLVRGPLAKGLLSGKYDKSTRFTDAVRSRWHDRPESQKKLEGDLERVARLGQVVAPGEQMVAASLRYTLTHDCNPVTIPGATRPQQVKVNAQAGSRELADEERKKLLAAIE
jgi:aryl-alcohol dehydrogenase-like predicted oxidoreductase